MFINQYNIPVRTRNNLVTEIIITEERSYQHFQFFALCVRAV